jgi:hypothetical protein
LDPGYLTTRVGPGGRIEILQADPVVECTEQFLRQVTQTPTGQLGPHDGLSVTMVTFVGANRVVTYRIGEYDAEREVYTLRWPD